MARNTQIVNVYGYDYRAPRPSLVDGVLYVGSGDGSFHAVDAGSGKRVWRFEAKGKIRSNPLVHGTMVVFGTLDGLLYAVDRATGKEIWQQQLSYDVTSSPAMVGDRLVVGTRGAVLYALAPATGETLWTQSFWGSWVESTAVPYGSHFYIGSSDLRRVASGQPRPRNAQALSAPATTTATHDSQIGNEPSPTWTGRARIARTAWPIAITAKTRPEVFL